MSEENKRIKIYSYDNVWTVRKKVYSIYNIKLPVPVAPEQLGYFAGCLVVMFMPIFNFLPAALRFVIFPFLISGFLEKKKLDGKNPIRFFIGYIQYLITERNTYLEKFRIYPNKKEEKITLSWTCSRGNFSYEDLVDPKEKFQQVAKTNNKKRKSQTEAIANSKEIKPVKVKADPKKQSIKRQVAIKGKNENKSKKIINESYKALNKTVALYWLPGINDIKNKFIAELLNFMEKDNKKYSLLGEETKDIDYIMSSQELEGIRVIEADITIVICLLDENYLKNLLQVINEHKKVKKWKFVFMDLKNEEIREATDLMEDYKHYFISSDQREEEKAKVFRKMLK